MSGPQRRTGLFWKTYRLLYWTFVVGVLMSISLSVTWHVLGDSTAEASTTAMAVPACAKTLHTLYDSLNREGSQLLAQPKDADAVDAQWSTWSSTWRKDVRELRTQCPLEETPALSQLVDDVERLHLAWSTAIKGWTEVGRTPLLRLETRFAELEAGQ